MHDKLNFHWNNLKHNDITQWWTVHHICTNLSLLQICLKKIYYCTIYLIIVQSYVD